MASNQHLIVTASDARCGDFLVDHWYQSLRENVRMDGVDIVVLDYGLEKWQQAHMAAAGLEVRPCRRDGHVTNIRYRDTAAVLRERGYSRVLMVDSGDVIFQADIRDLFDDPTEMIRAVCDERKYSLHAVLPILDDFHPDQRQCIARLLADRPQINGGFVLGPAAAFLRLWEEFQSLTRSLGQFAADQVLLNYSLHRQGFEELPSRYNFVLVAATSAFTVRDGRFFDAAGCLIPVVHNAGGHTLFRRVARFGYGHDRNVVKISSYLFVRTLFLFVHAWARLRRWV